MKPASIYKLIVASFTLLSLLACSWTFTAEFPTATIPAPAEPPTIPPLPTPTPANPPPFVISTLNFNETGQNSEYTIDVQFPAILENNDPRAQAFNDEIHALVQGEIAAFKLSVLDAPDDPAFAASSFDVKFGMLFKNDRISSIKFDHLVYISGAAHPYGYSRTVNYDFHQGKSLSLDELFHPGSNYLEAIAKYCSAELSQRDIGFDVLSTGAAPTLENYRNWNITPNGLMITFDQYQVAAGAAGSQTVVVPYGELQAGIAPEGPLAGIVR